MAANTKKEMTTAVLKNNFGLREEEFLELKAQLVRGDETLFQKIFFTHFESCIAYLQQQYRIPREKAYDVSMDALLAFRRKLLENRISYGNLRFLFTQMASHIYLKEVGRAPSQAKKQEAQAILSELTYELDKEELSILNKAWSKLGERCKALLTAVYYQNRQLKDIAEEEQQSSSTVRKQKQRCVEKLRQFYKLG
ncbi:MAG: sigma factor-like helix-turn-helix DNA-binding protein [Bacteroidota bacterium]